MNYLLKCKHCGKEFSGLRSTATYCSGNCRIHAHLERKEVVNPSLENASSPPISGRTYPATSQDLPQMKTPLNTKPENSEQLIHEQTVQPASQPGKEENTPLSKVNTQHLQEPIQTKIDESEEENDVNWWSVLGVAGAIGLAFYLDNKTSSKGIKA